MTKEPKTEADSENDIETGLDEPIDAEFREAEMTAAKARSGPGWGASLFLAVLAALCGGALGYGATMYLPGSSTGSEDQPRAVDIDQFDTLTTAFGVFRTEVYGDLEALETELERRAEANLSLASQADLNALRVQLDALETRPTTPPISPDQDIAATYSAIETLSGQLEALSERIRMVETASAQTNPEHEELASQLSADILSLRNQVSSLESRLDGLSSEVEDLSTRQETESTARSNAALALASIDAAARRGDGFAPALAALKRARPDDRRLDRLDAIALDGAPTLSDLKASFPTAAEQAKSALMPAANSTGAMALIDGLFGDALEVRNTDAEASYAALEAAEDDLAQGDVDQTLRHLETLEPAARDAMADWITRAEARRDLEATLDMLRLDLMAEDR